MLSVRRSQNDVICVLVIDSKVLDLPGVIISDRNAASNYVRFSSMKEGLERLDRERIFAQYWTHYGDLYDEMSHKSEKCAEVLVPNLVEPRYIVSANVANETALESFIKLRLDLTVCIKNDIFF